MDYKTSSVIVSIHEAKASYQKNMLKSLALTTLSFLIPTCLFLFQHNNNYSSYPGRFVPKNGKLEQLISQDQLESGRIINFIDSQGITDAEKIKGQLKGLEVYPGLSSPLDGYLDRLVSFGSDWEGRLKTFEGEQRITLPPQLPNKIMFFCKPITWPLMVDTSLKVCVNSYITFKKDGSLSCKFEDVVLSNKENNLFHDSKIEEVVIKQINEVLSESHFYFLQTGLDSSVVKYTWKFCHNCKNEVQSSGIISAYFIE